MCVCACGGMTHKTANRYGIRVVDVKKHSLSVHPVTTVSTEYGPFLPFCFRTCSNCSKKNRKTDAS